MGDHGRMPLQPRPPLPRSGNRIPLITPILHQPAASVARLRNLGSRITPPHVLQQAAIRAISTSRGHDLGDTASIASSALRLVAKVELHALTASDELIDSVGADAPGWIQAHFNPSELSRSVKTAWTEVKVPGLGHPIIHYGGTEAQVVRCSLFFDAFLFAQQHVEKTDPLARGAAEIAKAHRFLEACNYERTKTANGPIDGAPPRLYFYWPNALSLRCVLESVEFKYLMHAPTGHILRFTADIQLKEIRDERLTYEAVAANGAERFKAVGRLGADGESAFRTTA